MIVWGVNKILEEIIAIKGSLDAFRNDFSRLAQSNDRYCSGGMLDIIGPQCVIVTVADDRKTLWVNVDGYCRLRIQDIPAGMINLPGRKDHDENRPGE